jgi:hypothetical protein
LAEVRVTGLPDLACFFNILRHANIPAFGGILPLFTPFPAIPRGIHEIPLFQMLHNVSNRPVNYSTWHLSFKPEYALLHHQRASAMINSNNSVELKLVKNYLSGQLSVKCYMHGEAVLFGEPMTADL